MESDLKFCMNLNYAWGKIGFLVQGKTTGVAMVKNPDFLFHVKLADLISAYRRRIAFWQSYKPSTALPKDSQSTKPN